MTFIGKGTLESNFPNLDKSDLCKCVVMQVVRVGRRTAQLTSYVLHTPLASPTLYKIDFYKFTQGAIHKLRMQARGEGVSQMLMLLHKLMH